MTRGGPPRRPPSAPGSTGAGLDEHDPAVVAEGGRRYDSRQQPRNDADHTAALPAEFVDRFAVVGDPDRCVERIAELHGLGLERFVLVGPTFGADRDAARLSRELVVRDVLPALHTLDPGGTP